MTTPLDGLVVIDISQVMPGAIAGMLLADHGAEVIKVEPAGGAFFAGDPSRKSWDRGKLSITLDIGNETDRTSLRGLIDRADILLHSLTPAELGAHGLDWTTLAESNPGLISCALSAYGDDTPFRDRPYGESLAAARLGVMSTLATSRRPGPFYLGHPAIHYGQAFIAVIDVLAALHARRANGTGQAVDASLLDAAAAMSVMHWWQEAGQSFISTPDRGSKLRFGHTRLITAMYEASDGGFLQIHTGGAGGFKRAMDVLGFGDRIATVSGPEFAVPLSEDEYHAARFEVDEAFLKKPRDEWIALFHAADVAALPVLPPAEILLDEQIEATGQRMELADAEHGRIKQSRPPLRFRRHAPADPAPAPRVGEHDDRLAALLARPARARPAPSAMPVRAPLQGVRIVDLGVFFACSFAARLLSDLGADVIKIEGLEGDQMRPLPDLYDGAQRGKRNIAINLKAPAGREAARRLIGEADIVLHNLRVGNAEKLGVGAAEMMAANPRLIYAYLPGYGSTGPKAKLKSFAPLLSGWTGPLYEGGGEGNPPTTSVFGSEDNYNGLLGAVALLMGLEARARNGEGDYVECPQVHSSLFTTSEHYLTGDDAVIYGMRLDAEQRGFNALDRIYAVKDGDVCIAARADAAFAALATAIGQPELAADPSFATPAGRVGEDAALKAILTPWFEARTKDEAFAALDAAGVPVEIVREKNWMSEYLHEDWAREAERVFEYRESMTGHIKVIGLMTRLHGTPGLRRGPAAHLGEHTEQILGELGYSRAEIAAMVKDRAVLAANMGAAAEPEVA
jgi:crotonobetainyl-CoA:carnitine CoA-transferase CaiB-like acyl-CoA transferase